MPFSLGQIDSRIPESAAPSADQGGSTLFGTIGQMMQMKDQMAQEQERQQKIAQTQRDQQDQNDINTAFANNPTPEDGIKALVQSGRTTAAQKALKFVNDQRKQQNDDYSATLKQNDDRIVHSTQMLQGLHGNAEAGDLYQSMRPHLIETLKPIYGDSINDMLPTVYDEAKVDGLVAAGMKASDYNTMRKNASDLLSKAYEDGDISSPWISPGLDKNGKPLPSALDPHGAQPGVRWAPKAMDRFHSATSLALQTADSEVEHAALLDTLKRQGVPDEILKAAPAWNPDRKAYLADVEAFGRTEAEQGAAETRAETARSHAATEAETAKRDATTARNVDSEIAARAATAAGVEKPLTTKQETDLKTKRNAANEKAYQTYQAATAQAGGAPDKLKQANDDFVAAKIRNENDFRSANPRYGGQSMELAAQAAVDSGDQQAYNNVMRVYDGLATPGALAKEVPWDQATNPALRGKRGATSYQYQSGADAAAAGAPATPQPAASRPAGPGAPAAAPAAPAATAASALPAFAPPRTMNDRRQMLDDLYARYPTATPEDQQEIKARLLKLHATGPR